MHSKGIPAALAVLFFCSLTACSTVGKSVPAPAAPAVSSAGAAPVAWAAPVARVNGVAVTRAELALSVKTLVMQNRLPAELPPSLAKQAEEMALDQLVSAELLYQEGSKSVDAKDLDRLVDEEFAKTRTKFASEADLEKSLRDTGMTVAQARDLTRKQIIINKFVEARFAGKETVSEDEAKKFFEQNRSKYFTHEEKLRASHILVGVDAKAGADEKKKAQEKAEGILKQLQKGEDFAALAKKESTCPSAARGGDLGLFGKGQMVPPFEQAAFALKPGELSGVVETRYGYHIIKLTERIARSEDKFDDVKERILGYLKAEKVKKAVVAYVASDLKGKAKIERIAQGDQHASGK